MQSEKVKVTPKQIFEEYKSGVEYKTSIGDRGIHEQSKMNERFYVGDQWYGAQAGNSRPLVRRNIIKRIGEYKMAVIGSSSVAVNYSAEGIPDTTDLDENKKKTKEKFVHGEDPFADAALGASQPDAVETSVVMSALSEYFKTTAERLKFNDLSEQVLRNSYISGTGFLYTYWDSNIETGLYADERKTAAIKGDIMCEVLDVENVNLGDPNSDSIQSQPYIIISQRKQLGDVRREARRYKQNVEEIKADNAESYLVNSGDRGEQEPDNSKRVTVLTKIWKEYDNDTDVYTIKAIRVTENAIVRPEWDMNITLYPIAKFSWERRRSCGYGDSEVTYLIPNQIAINRALTAAVWATMNAGMPKIIVNRDGCTGQITNDPGQIVDVNAGDRDVSTVIKYLQPPSFAGQFEGLVNDIANNTLTDSGANDAALGSIKPDNAAAIIQVREAALQPMQIYRNRYYNFIEDMARIWSDFWIHMYGNRSLKITDRNGTYYVPFNAERYKNLVIKAKVDVGVSTVWSEAVVVSTLSGLLEAGIITAVQYLERLPKGIVPDVTGLINDITQTQQQQQDQNTQEHGIMQLLAEQHPDLYAKFTQLPPEQQKTMMNQFATGGETV